MKYHHHIYKFIFPLLLYIIKSLYVGEKHLQPKCGVWNEKKKKFHFFVFIINRANNSTQHAVIL